MSAPERKDIPEEFKWDLNMMYKTREDFEKEFKSVKPMLPALTELKGKLADETGESLKKCMELSNDIDRTLERLITYASHKYDEDTRVSESLSDRGRVISLIAEINTETSWISPEVMEIPDEALAKIKAAECMRPWLRALEIMLHAKPHILSPSEERIMSLTTEMMEGPHNGFSALNEADMKFPMVKSADGKSEVELTHANFIQLENSFDREVRKLAFEGLYDTYDKVKNTMTALLDGVVRTHVFRTRARRYSSSLEAALYPDCIPVDVYTSLIEAVHKSLPAFYKYVSLRKRCLKMEGPLDMYDQYVPITPDFDPVVPYEQAKEWIREALKPLGPDYLKLLEEVLTTRCIDVKSNRGKRSGAYSGGCYDSKPYILTNYVDNLDSAFTLVHELGHSIHTQLSKIHQPYQYASYKLFVAEVASTTNECLLYEFLMKKARAEGDKAMQMFLLNHKCHDFKSTLFRQVMFAEFEKIIHDKVESGDSLTADYLQDTYYELNKLYYGPDVNADRRISLEWARIPHFYYNFYVYKYATSICVAHKITADIMAGKEGATENYLKFLSSGCIIDPLDLLRVNVGVDLTKPDCVSEAIELFSKYVDELSQVIG